MQTWNRFDTTAMAASEKSLKAQNIGWLWGVVVADILVLLAVAFPTLLGQTAIKEYAWVRTSAAAVAPVVVLLLTSLLSADAKAVLVFWRIRDTLPGHRAFSVHALADPRIDIEALRKNVGAFPESPRDQNALWYRLYTKVGGEVAVALTHRHFLLFRDLATLSFLLAVLVPTILYFLDAAMTAIWSALALFAIQYFATAIAARNNGVRMVTNVLSLHSSKRRP